MESMVELFCPECRLPSKLGSHNIVSGRHLSCVAVGVAEKKRTQKLAALTPKDA